MTQRTTQAGGFLLMVAILGGSAWGISAGNPMLGALGGSAVGILAALLLWLIDRRR